MEAFVHLDTHVVAWLYAGAVQRFPPSIRRQLERSTLACSPMVMLELQYLYEVGRLTVGAREVVDDLKGRVGLTVATASLGDAVFNALAMTWTRDPFDRVIAAHAYTEGAPLLTADESMHAHLPLARWG